MTHPRRWPRWVVLCVGLSAGAAGVGVVLALHTRPADSGIADPPPEVTCRGVLREPGFYAGRRVRLSTVGMSPGPDPHALIYTRVLGLPPVLVATFAEPVPVPLPAFVAGRVEVPDKGPVLVTGCRPD